MEDIVILLTKTQAEKLLEFFDLEFIPMIRKNLDIDNMDYLTDMCEIYTQIKREKKNAKARAELGLKLSVPAFDIIDVDIEGAPKK